jgi:hypothetical protein
MEKAEIGKMRTMIEIVTVTRKQETLQNIASEMATIHCILKSSVAEILGFTKGDRMFYILNNYGSK